MTLTDTPPLGPAGQRTLLELLLTLATAKHELGFRCAFWSARAPGVEARIALAGMALEEEGHAKVLEGFMADELGGPPLHRDALVTWDMWPGVADTSSKQRETWPEALVAYWAQDSATTAILRTLSASPNVGLAQRASKMVQEEQFHDLFAIETLRVIGSAAPDARNRLVENLATALREDSPADGLLRSLADRGYVPPDTFARYLQQLREREASASALTALRGGADG